MRLPFEPPQSPEEMQRRGREFQQLPPSERWRILFATIAKGFEEIAKSPDREKIERWLDEQEEEGNRRQRELFRRFGKLVDGEGDNR
jgi:hypothetical protein